MIFVVKVEDAVIAKLRRSGKEYEILVDCFKAMELREGKDVNMRDLLAVEEVFSDARKGLKAGGLETAFGTLDVFEISKEIIKKGEVQITQKYRKKIIDEKRKRIVQKIAQNAADARTNAPVPAQRVELAMEQAKIHIDPMKSNEEMFKEVVEKLRPIIPLSFNLKKFRITVPAKDAPKSYGGLNRFKKLKEEWLSNGDLLCTIELPAGMVSEMYDVMNKLTHGNVMINEVK